MLCLYFWFFRQKTAYELRISDWSSDVCSADLLWLKRSFASFAGGLELAMFAYFGAFYSQASYMPAVHKIGRASCRERVCQYVWISVVAVSLNKKTPF